MKTLEQIKNDLKGLYASEEEFENDVICEFEDYEVNGSSEIIVENTNTETNVEGYGLCQEWCAYANNEAAPVINFAIKKTYDEEMNETNIEIVEVF